MVSILVSLLKTWVFYHATIYFDTCQSHPLFRILYLQRFRHKFAESSQASKVCTMFINKFVSRFFLVALLYSLTFRMMKLLLQRFNAYKYHWSDSRQAVTLEVNPGSLDQIDPTSNRHLCGYDYKDMEGMLLMSDYPGGLSIKHGGFGRLVNVSCLFSKF